MTPEQHPAAQIRLERFVASLTSEYESLFATPKYKTVSTKTTPAQLARRIALGLDNGTADKDGEGVKRACKALGIKHTYKDIRAWLRNKELTGALL